MKRKITAILLAACLLLALAACGDGGAGTAADAPESESPATESPAAGTLSAGVSDMFSDRDYEVGYSSCTTVTLADGATAADGAGVSIEGDVITLSLEGSYVISGSLTNGRIVVDAPDTAKLQLVLDGADVSCEGSAALYIVQADKVFLTLADGTENSLASTGEFVQTDDNNVDAAIFSKEDLTLNGSGALSVACQSGHGVVSKDDLRVTGGSYTVTAAKKGLSGKDSVRIAGGSFDITSGTDGVYSQNEDGDVTSFIYISDCSMTVSSGDDALHTNGGITVTGGTFSLAAADDGMHADATLDISGGSVTVSASYEGLEAAAITLSGGTIDITASDDGLNAAGGNDASSREFAMGGNPFDVDTSASITISGGEIHIDAAGDGIDSNGSLLITGGVTYVSGPTNSANGALDYGGSGSITGGVLVAAGAAGMAQNMGSESTQGSILYNLSSTQPALSAVTLTDSSGAVLASYTPVKEYQSVVISAPGIEADGTYTLTAGDESAEIQMTGLIYGSGGFGGFGGMMGGGAGGRGERPADGTMPDRGERPADGSFTPPDGDIPEDFTPPDGGTPPDATTSATAPATA